MNDSTKTLTIKNFSSEVPFKSGERLLDILNANKVGISQSCGGNGSCTTCRVLVLKGLENCSAKEDIELEHSLERGFEPYERLSCQTFLTDTVTIQIEVPE